MKRHRGAIALGAMTAVVWLALAALPAAAGPGAEPGGSGRHVGLLWGGAGLIGEASVEPSRLSLLTNLDGTHSLIYEAWGLWHTLLDTSGQPLLSPTYLGKREQEIWAMRGGAPRLARDAAGSLHVVWSEGGTEIHYARFDARGRAIIADRLLRANPCGAHGASLALVDEGSLIGYVSYEPSLGHYCYNIQLVGPGGANVGPALSLTAPDGSEILDGVFSPSESGGLHIVLSTTSGGMYLRVGPAGALEVATGLPMLARGTLPALAQDGEGRAVLAWRTSEANQRGRIAAARPGASGAEMIVLTSVAEALSDPTLAVGPGGEVFVGWLDARYGEAVALCSVLRPGDWSAYPPNLRVTPASSPSSNLALAADPGGGLHAVWAEGASLLHARARTAGFSLSPPQTGACEAIVHPHESTRVAVDIANTGGAADTLLASLDASGLPPGWSASLPVEELSLPQDESATIEVLVTASEPVGGAREGSVRLELRSTSSPGLVRTIDIPVRMEVRHRILGEIEPGFSRAAPGTPALFELELRNEGDVEEELLLSVLPDPLLSVSMNRTVCRIPRGATERATVTALPSPQASVGAALTISIRASPARAGEGLELFGTVLVLPPVELSISADEREALVPPGGGASFLLTVGNSGASPGPANVVLEVVSGGEGWSASLSPSSLLLQPGEEGRVRLELGAPTSASGRLVVRVRASSGGWGATVSTTVTAIVAPSPRLSTSPLLPGVEGPPGAALPIAVLLRNTGNLVEEVRAGFELPGESWRAEAQELPDPLVVAPGEGATIRALVHVPAEALAGNYTVIAALAARSGAEARTEFTVAVREVRELSLSTSTITLRTSPGDAVYALLRLTNPGNAPDTVSLFVDTPPGWGAALMDDEMRPLGSLGIPARGAAGLVLELRAPYLSPDVWSEISVSAVSQSGLRASLALRVGLLLPDLSLKVSYSPQRIFEGAQVLATVTVTNTGDVPARGVQVSFRVDGGGARYEELALVPGGSSRTAAFVWRASAGSHALRFEVDPSNLVMERDESNNIFVERVGLGGAAPSPQPLPAGAAIIGAAAIGLAALGAATGGTESGKYWFLSVLFIPLYTKIKRDDILDHFIRGQVYGYIKANPGEHYNSIKKALSLKNGTLMYHLKTLEREDFIKSVVDGRFRRFYPKDMKIPDPSEELVLKMNHIQREILRIIRESPGISQKELAARIGLSPPTVHYHVDIMTAARLVTVRRAGRETQCFADEAGEGSAG
ncbi:MAG: winged helix-turn-helix transcriptional regulator [Thermoplasmatota archaeon]